MNENTLQSQRTHTRVKFEPLNVSCSLVCLTPQSPTAQTVNTLLSPVEYEPDRSVSPTIILPDVRAVDIDGVFKHGSANQYLSLDTIKWTVNGEPIDEVWNSASDYEIITTADDSRGALRIYKNLNAGEKAVLKFSAELLDWRTGIGYIADSDEMPLTCTDKGESTYKCSVDKPLVEYDPLYDDLLLYDYKVAHGISVGSRSQYVNGKCYEQSIGVVLTFGIKEQSSLPSGVTMRLVELNSTTAIVPNSETNPEVLLATYPNIKIDMRFIGHKDYEVQFIKDSKIIARATVGLHTSTSMPMDGKPVAGADIAASQTEYFNQVLVNLADRLVEYPELYYMIKWFTQAKVYKSGAWSYDAEKGWQRGTNMEAPIKDLGIGLTVNDSFFDIWFNIDAHEPCELCLDENSEVLLDEDGVYLID